MEVRGQNIKFYPNQPALKPSDSRRPFLWSDFSVNVQSVSSLFALITNSIHVSLCLRLQLVTVVGAKGCHCVGAVKWKIALLSSAGGELDRRGQLLIQSTDLHYLQSRRAATLSVPARPKNLSEHID